MLTTPNREYNVVWPNLAAGAFRHDDHRFEWTREEFQTWATGLAEKFGYAVEFQSVGPEHENSDRRRRWAVFQRAEAWIMGKGVDVSTWLNESIFTNI